MAPDRGMRSDASTTTALLSSSSPSRRHRSPRRSAEADDDGDDVRFAPPSSEDRHFSLRAVLVGILIGIVLCFSNMYFGLQTGWISTMQMPATVMGFGFFKAISRHLKHKFSPVENVLVTTVAASVGIVPLGAGFVGVIPALNYLLLPEEKGPVRLSIPESIVWSLGLCYFGCVFAMMLRHQMIIREKLRFPSGFSAAVLIGVLHGKTTLTDGGGRRHSSSSDGPASPTDSRQHGSVGAEPTLRAGGDDAEVGRSGHHAGPADAPRHAQEWKSSLRLLLICFCISGLYTLTTYFVPLLRSLPVFGSAAAGWLWTLNPSLAYVGQGIIIGPANTLHMLLGAVVGWAILSPLAKSRGWTPGPVGDWETGSKGWIVWTSLSIMLADAVVSLGYIAFASLPWPRNIGLPFLLGRKPAGYSALDSTETEHETRRTAAAQDGQRVAPGQPETTSRGAGPTEADAAPVDPGMPPRVIIAGLVLSMLFCMASIHVVFGSEVPLYAVLAAVVMALPLSVVSVRCMGVTDLNPVSGISKLAQVAFVLVVPRSNKAGVLINLVAGAVSEAAALEAAELSSDLKTGHMVGARAEAQFWGQAIGATVGAIVSAFVYKLYTTVYEIPGELFQAPTALVWIFTARLVTSGEGLPPMAIEWASGAAALFAVLTAVKMQFPRARWQSWIPGGLAVAVGMYNVPSFTLARTIGGLLSWYWKSVARREDTPLIILASGFILGEGILSIANLLMESFGVPHL